MVNDAAELVARASYGRLLALLASRTRDISGVEDALADAFVAALTTWPASGVPASPEAWLLTTARRRLADGHRRRAVRERATDDVGRAIEELGSRASGELPDDRLRLMFVCTHPAIDHAVQVPLMLQTVLGLDAELIASAFRVAPKTMGQRLWRAKTKIREARISFDVPERSVWPERLHTILEATYAAFGTAWEDLDGGDVRVRGLAEEALFIARLLVQLVPDDPEPRGLLALMLFSEARRPARRDAAGAYVPLPLQDRSRWSRSMLAEAEQLLTSAFAAQRIGPFQLEAAIQSAHVDGAVRGRLDHAALLALYEGLLALAPSLGASIAYAAAIIEPRGPDAALHELDRIPEDLSRDYQPFWAVRAEALRVARRDHEATQAYTRAIALAEDESIRAFLRARAATLSSAR